MKSDWLLAQLPSVQAIGAGGQGFDFRASQIGAVSPIAATFLRSCIAQVLSRGDGPCHLLHALAF